MQALLRRALALVLPLLVLLTAPPPAEGQEPFAGMTASVATAENVGDCFDETDYVVMGKGTVLGHFTGGGTQRVSYCGAPDIQGDVTLTAADGDQLSLHYVGTRVDLNTYTCTVTATGGTRRFENAVVDATLVIPAYAIGHPFDGTFNGTIEFP